MAMSTYRQCTTKTMEVNALEDQVFFPVILRIVTSLLALPRWYALTALRRLSLPVQNEDDSNEEKAHGPDRASDSRLTSAEFEPS